MSESFIQELLAYPIAGGGSVVAENASEMLRLDRKFVVFDQNDPSKRLYQNKHPLISVIRPVIEDGYLSLSVSEGYEDPERFGRLRIPLDEFSNELHVMEKGGGSATDYPRSFEASTALDPKVSEWLKDLLGDGNYNLAKIVSASEGSKLARLDMNDGFHLVDRRSLALLNRSLANVDEDVKAIPMSRFRGNFIIDGESELSEPEELRWKIVHIEGLVFNVSPTQRCVYVTKDQETGESMGREPLAFLASKGKGIWNACFGVYLHINTLGGADFSAIKVGSVVKKRE